MIKIATVINFCSMDYKFLRPCVKGVLPFSDVVIVPYADHLFDDTPENMDIIGQAVADNPEVIFKKFNYHHSITEYLRPRFWHNFARWVGISHLPENIDYVLFLDVDEIVESPKFVEFLNHFDIARHDYMYFSNYWYFREPRYRASQVEDSPVLVKRNIINVNVIFHEWERALFSHLPNGIRRVNGLDGEPMFHHYSWVLNKEEMLQKVRTWGHSRDTDKDWVALINVEFSREFNGTDFIHGYQYEAVTPLVEFNPVENQPVTLDRLIQAARDAINVSNTPPGAITPEAPISPS